VIDRAFKLDSQRAGHGGLWEEGRRNARPDPSSAPAGWQKAVVALANKNARILWAVMTKGDAFDARHVSVKPGAPAPAAASA
jgi:hypothetical protein